MPAFIQGLRNKGGYGIITDPGAKQLVQEYETYMCCHHGGHFYRKPGQGPPAICLRCMDITCGSKPCDVCIPFEALLEAWEGTRRFWKELDIQLDHRNIH